MGKGWKRLLTIVRWGAIHEELTLELNVRCEGGELCGAERPLLGDVVIWQMPRLGKGGQVKGRQY